MDIKNAIVHVLHTPLRFETIYHTDSFDKLRCRFSRFSPAYNFAPSAFLPKRPAWQAPGPKRPRERMIATSDGWIPGDGSWWRFDQVADQFDQWLRSDVKPGIDEMAIADMWVAAVSAPTLFREPARSEFEMFTSAERAQIRVAIAKFSTLIASEYQLDADQIADVRVRLDYLAAATDRLNKFDWKALALATMIGVATNLSLDTTTGQQLWKMFTQVFRVIGHVLTS